MNTFQIAQTALEGYKNTKLSDERIDTLVKQAKVQIEEIAKNKELYNDFVSQVDAPNPVDDIILWVLFMSDEDIRDTYIETFNKDFRDDIPISDLGDLLIYLVYLKKVKDVELEGYAYLEDYEGGEIEDVDQFALTNAFLYIQKTKEVQIDF